MVTTQFFLTLRTNPEIGRGFLAGRRPAWPRQASFLLGNEIWKERFGSDSGILEKTIRLDGLDRA